MKPAPLLIALMIPFAASAEQPLNVKTGTWELTVVVETQGVPTIPAEALAMMPPEQRAALEALIARNEGMSQPRVSNECVTQEDLTKPFEPVAGERCETTVLRGTATSQDVAVKCSGKHPSSGQMHIDAPTPESMKGVIDLALDGTDNPIKVKTHMTGRWLSSACKAEDK